MHYDENYSTHYYFNPITRMTTWTKPKTNLMVSNNDGNWKVRYDNEHNRLFYVNPMTEERSWSKPSSNEG